MIYLSSDSIVPERLFTHPQHTVYDARQLRYMIATVCRLFEMGRLSSQPQPLDRVEVEPDGRTHRLLIIRPDELEPTIERPPLTVVGFFGQRLVGKELKALQSRDDLLVELMEGQTGLLSYTTLELTCGNFANCILFASEEAKDSWGKNAVHREIARELSPYFYNSIRLYNGVLSKGIGRPETLHLRTVKYFDYRSQPVWRAERRLVLD